MSESDPPGGEFKTITQAQKPPPTKKAGKVTDAHIIAFENTQTTLLKRFDTIETTMETTLAASTSTFVVNNAKLDLLLNRLPATLDDNLKAMTINICTVTKYLKIETESQDNLKTFS